MRCIFLTPTGWRKTIDSMKPKKVGSGVSEFNLLHDDDGGGSDGGSGGSDDGGGDGSGAAGDYDCLN